MLARYYVYEQHMGRRKSACKARRGIRKLELSRVETRREYQKTISVGELTG
jgi:hypothetical protein